MQTIDTDILVIGGGSAGMRAAIAARESGLDVALTYKSGGNCSAIAAGGFAAVLCSTHDDSVQKHYENTMASACGLAEEKLVRLLTSRGAEALNTALSWGVKFYTHEDGSLRPFRSGGHSALRTYRCVNGNTAQFFKILASRVDDCGVTLLRNYTIMELLTENTRVCGACGVDAAGNPVVIRAKAVVLASGGFAGAYSNTTNPKAMTGEGCMMGYKVGCTLSDLEFVQFMPTTFAFPTEMAGKLVNDTLRGEGAVLRNALQERFMKKYDPVYGDLAARDILSIAIVTEVAEGRGTPHNGVYLDAREVPPQKMAESFGSLRRLMAFGIAPHKDMIEVTPSAHFSCGGIRIDETCGTGVEGLFAAGEVSAGIHGANRLGANAMTETLVFGEIAGLSAATFARTVPAYFGNAPESLLMYAKDSLRGSVSTTPEIQQTTTKLKNIFWDALGVSRSAQPLQQALESLQSITADLREISPQTIPLSANVQRELWIKTAMLGTKVAEAALQRCESRGTHFRSDYKETKDRYVQHNTFHKDSNTQSHKTRIQGI